MKFYKFIQLATVAAALNLTTTVFSRDRDIDKLILQPDGYHKAALASGGTYQVSGRFTKSIANDLKQLTDGSSTIVVASVSNATTELVDEGRYLLTYYKLHVTEVIKGDMATTDLLEIPGGSYKFSDGSVVNQVDDVWKPLQVGKTYMLFLSRWPDRPAILQLASAAQGIFEVAFDNRSLISYTHVQNDPIRDEASLGKAAFLAKVKAMVANAG